jgi:acylphosphatase
MNRKDSIRRARALVSGRVQGVGFRHYARKRARELGLTGWVRNLPGGIVEMCFQGRADATDRMEDWLREGSPLADVRRVVIVIEPVIPDESSFEIV